MQLRHVVFTLEDGFEYSVRLHCMFVIWLIVFHGFFTNANFFIASIWDPFLLTCKNCMALCISSKEWPYSRGVLQLLR